MANIVEFVLSLKDLMSAGMQHAEVQAKHSMRGAELAVDKVGKAAANASSVLVHKMHEAVRGPRYLDFSIDELKNKLESINRIRYGTVMASEFRKADREAKKLERQIGRLENGITRGGIRGKMAGWRKDFISQLPGGRFLSNPLTLAGGVLTGIGKIAQMGMKAQQEIAGLSTFVGNKASEVYAQIQKDAAHTPFSVEAFKTGSQALLSTGLSAQRTRTDMMNLANAVAAVGGNNEVFQRMAINMQQVKTQGHAMGMDIRQFAMASINIYDLLAKSTGKSIPELKKMTITYDMLSKALADAGEKGGAYYHGLYNQTHTLAGRVKILKTEFMIMLQNIGLKLQPYLRPIVDFAEKAVSGIETIFKKFGQYAAPAIAIIGGLAAAILVAAAAQWAFNAAQLANPITWIIVGVIALIAAIAYMIYKIDGWGKAWTNLVKIASSQMDFFKDGVKLAWLYIKDYFLSGIETIEKAWYKLERLWNKDDANEGLNRLANEGKKRADEIAKQKRLLENDAYRTGKAAYDLIHNSFSIKKEVTLSSVKDGLMKKLGMGDGFGGGNLNQAAATSSGITSGGPRTITINVNKEMIGKLAINSYNVKEGVGEMENLIEEGLRRILYSAAAS